MASKRDPTRADARAQERKRRDAEIKKQAARLKKLALLYAKKDLRKVKVTSYMRKKVREFSPVLTGDAVVLLPPKGKKAKDFAGRDDVLATPNGRVVVTNDPDAVKGFRGGRRSTVIPLGDGNNIELLELPIDGRDIELVAEFAESGKLDRFKQPREFFAIRLNGQPAAEVFPNARALAYKLSAYQERSETLEVFVYRVWPPGEWEDLVKRERGEAAQNKAFLRRVEKERRKANRKPRFTPEQTAEAKAAQKLARMEVDRLRKRAARLKTTDDDRAKNAERMRQKRAKK